MNPFKTVREYENAHIVLWLIKDSCWVSGVRGLGMAMIIPTLLVAIDIARRSWNDATDFAHNLAVCFWISANAVWMTGEFFYNDTWRAYASVFFGMGLITLAWHYVPLVYGKLWGCSADGQHT